ncbi:MAG: ABC transporter permease [Clostridiales bacterium]|nr:ABC transporter permease [Clostridiales bacterium]
MMVLLVLKERMRAFYARFSPLVNGLTRFALSLAALWMMRVGLGYMALLTNPLVMVALSLVCAFLPFGAISLVLAAVMLGHIYTASFEIALLLGVFLVIVALLYYGFHPGDSCWLILTPIAFALKVPFVIPLLAGLSGGLLGIIPVSCGIVVYYILSYVRQNVGVLTNDASVDITQKYVQIIRALVSNRTMLVFIIACAAGILVTCLVRRLALDYAWIFAIIIGYVSQLAVIFAGDFVLDISVPAGELIFGSVFALAIAGLFHFFVFAVDYSRTEYINFEDDDYVYYVKAVPKIMVSAPDVRVQRINDPARARRGGRPSERSGSGER